MGAGQQAQPRSRGIRAALTETWGLVGELTRRPVETYERISARPSLRAGFTLVGLIALAFGLAGAVLAAAVSGPAEALKVFILWAVLGVSGVYLAAGGVIWLTARMLGSRAPFRAVLAAWAGSYVPTVVWYAGLFFVHLLVARPGLAGPGAATGGPGGPPVVLQIVFLAFSVACLLWKALLLYLTLRVVGGLDFRRIAAATALLAPVALGYWLLGLHLGWFKVPVL